MRYLFRGVVRDTGRVVDGHIQANDPNEACIHLAENGIVTESLREDPVALNLTREMPPSGFASAIDSALDASSTQVPFDELTDRYKGKQVWVIDRDKIRSHVAQVVDAALDQSAKEAEGQQQTRQRVALAIQGLFTDNRNLTSPTNSALDTQIARLASVIKQAEYALSAITAAARRSDGAGPRRLAYAPQETPSANHEVLLEIFTSNLELKRSLEGEPPALEAEPAPPAPPVETPAPAAPA